ncbi:MAG: MopE-related protein [Candidatus Thorarchaeota archaeon]
MLWCMSIKPVNAQASGNNLWYIRINTDDRFHSNEAWLKPWRYDYDDGWGKWEGGYSYLVQWYYGPYLQSSGSLGGLSWSIDSNGNLHVSAPRDYQWHAWTYIYVDSPKSISIPGGGDCVPRIFLNYAFSNPIQFPGPLNLSAGWNRLDITGYNQNSGYSFNLNYALASNVDLMNSSRINIPPELNTIGNKSRDEGILLEFTVDGWDPDGDVLSYSASNLPPGATFNPVTQVFSWIADFDQSGEYQDVTFTVTDDGSPSLSDSETISITIFDVNCDGSNPNSFPGAPEICDGEDNNCDGVIPINEGDTDGDGTLDCQDNCPNDPAKTDPGLCGCGVTDTDSDGDGTPDCQDLCPSDPVKIDPGLCGCGIADTDSDGDRTPDCQDNCPSDPVKIDPGLCGCGVTDTDSDGDGTPNCQDLCPNDPVKTDPGLCGCGIADTDSDSDGTPNCQDLCPNDPAKTDPDLCGCGVTDTDSDGDGTPDCQDLCPNDPAKIDPGLCGCGIADIDSDGDGVLVCNDCDDNNPNIFPGAMELCDDLDNSCDGSIDEGCDDDDDDYCDANMTVIGAPSICPNGGGDCDDNNFGINPGACDIKNNGIDEDCNGSDRTTGPPCQGVPEICNDGVDNDRDNKIDCIDPDCNNESICGGTENKCKDGIDNDNDSFTDCADSDCTGKQGCP